MNAVVRKARKKPVDIEFMVWPGGAASATPVINWVLEMGGTARWREADATLPELITIDTLEGTMQASPGDVIIRGVEGEFYPCKPGIFRKTYDILEED
ncbi:hypothetical protein SEA_ONEIAGILLIAN_56 [Microbacterium phage OneinaGillian]|uniref:Uncharacterized protein n=1 Tax=Microbacterium phage OneinaGillian TaxID=2301604 RepID=A0A385UGA2_9CAUD|nr:hypothetical protein HOU23_gp056 [Microbacterium phage OneinaGillian]AYB70166.1 hypothetical protein SEA_ONEIAGILLIAN_56 [Microbacterium phage OneinaGillian]